MNDEFYIQDTRNYVGNSMLWWKHDNCGYVCDIRDAKIFTKEEAEKICKRSALKRIWLKEYIDARISHHIDIQDCDIQDCIEE